MPLSYTPRKIAVHPEHKLFYVIESDHRTWGSEAKNKKLADLVGSCYMTVRSEYPLMTDD
jgi:splicing factor 3B subunit 3